MKPLPFLTDLSIALPVPDKSIVRSASLNVEQFSANLVDGLGFVFPREIDKAIPKRKCEYFSGRYLAYQALESLTGCGEFPGRHGKLPIWPNEVVGSVTHTKEFAAAVVAPLSLCRGIGIDCEILFGDRRLRSVSSAILSATDLSYKPSEMSMSFYATLVFSLKESIYKAINPIVKVFFGFSDAEIIGVDMARQRVKFRLCKGFGSGFNAGYEGEGSYASFDDKIFTCVKSP